MSGSQLALLGGPFGPPPAYQIQRSLRFNSADSAYLNRTPASAGNRKTFTISTWVKRSSAGSQAIMGVGTNTSDDVNFTFNSDKLYFLARVSSSIVLLLETTQVFRDFGAWYHFVVAVDTTQATGSNRVKMYVNGEQITAFGTATYPSQNQDLPFNNTVAHEIGRVNNQFGAGQYINGYLTEFNVIDGSALTPSSFGETNADTGVWQPKAYTGTYGTNGFQLLFADNSGTTSTTLGKDTSGNGNNWTPNNFSVTAGAGNDSLVDTPTPYGTDTGVGGEVRGNYATLNPLNQDPSSTLANGNLDLTTPVNTYGLTYGTIGVSSGKWYWEVTPTSMSGAAEIGIGKAGISLTAAPGGSSLGYVYVSSALKGNGGYTAYGATYTTNDVIGIALDLDAGTLVFYKNNSSQGTAFSSLSGEFFAVIADSSAGAGSAFTVNFGQRPFAYTAPSGFKALCTQNLPTPDIGATSATQAGKYFNTVLYTGTGSSLGVTGVGFQPDWVWIKERAGAADHGLYDAVRGVQKQLESNNTDAETTETTGLTAFNSDGFTVGALAQLNTNTDTYVAWNWKANGAGSSNTQGTITSTVSASTLSGFSIVTWTADGSNSNGVGHGLGVTPTFIIYKKRSPNDGVAMAWYVWTTVIDGSNDELVLNTTAAKGDVSAGYGSPTSTTISNYGFPNGNSLVAYCFAPVAGYSAFGSYTGNGSSDGTFVYTGFKPAWVLVKQSSASGEGWRLIDATRSPYNVANRHLLPNSTAAESTETGWDMLSNGFKLRSADAHENANGATYIYAAFAENPFKYSLAR